MIRLHPVTKERTQSACYSKVIYPVLHTAADIENLLLPQKYFFCFPHCTFKNTKLSHALKKKELFRNKLTIFDEMLLSLMKKSLLHDRLGIVVELRAQRNFYYFFSFPVCCWVCFAVAELLT